MSDINLRLILDLNLNFGTQRRVSYFYQLRIIAQISMDLLFVMLYIK